MRHKQSLGLRPSHHAVAINHDPRLAMLTQIAPVRDEYLHEIKFDGYRIMAYVAGGKAKLLSRNGLSCTDIRTAENVRRDQTIATRSILDLFLPGHPFGTNPSFPSNLRLARRL